MTSSTKRTTIADNIQKITLNVRYAMSEQTDRQTDKLMAILRPRHARFIGRTYSMPNEMRATMTTRASRRLKALRQNEPAWNSRPYAMI